MLKAFEEEGIPVDAIAATSMGAVVGSIYATGRSAGQLESVVKSLDWDSIWSGEPDRRLVPLAHRDDRYRTVAGLGFDFWELRFPRGLLSEYRVNRFLIASLAAASYAVGGDFDKLPRPFRCVATALDNGEQVVLARGSLPRAVRASMAIPLAFPPVEWDGRPLVDGGVVDNLPVDQARRFGADVVVAVDISSLPLTPKQYRSAFGVAAQASNLLSARANLEFREEPDVLIRPDIDNHGFNDYTGFDALIARGYEAAKAAIPDIRALLDKAARPAPERTPVTRTLEGTPIAAIEVRGNERYTEELIRRTFSIPLGPPFDLAKGLNALDRIAATGFFDYVWLDLEPAESGLRIVLQVKEAARNRVEVGASYDEELRARGIVRLRNFNTFGFGEQTELMGVASDGESGFRLRLRGDRLFTTWLGYEVTLRAMSDRPRYFVDGEEVDRADFVRKDARFAIRRGIKRSALFESAFTIGKTTVDERAGLPFPAAEDEVRLLELSGVFDVLDDRYYPSRRLRIEGRGAWNLADLGATHDYWMAELSGLGAVPLGARSVLRLDGMLGLSGGALQPYDWYRVGGPVRLPGYHINELWGPQAAAAALSYHYRVVRRLQVVARAGAGDVWQRREDIGFDDLAYGASLGFLYPTGIGPVTANVGVRRGGHTIVTFAIGYP